jgi:sialidase-1
MIEIVDTGIVYRNPSPHLRACQAWHPTAVRIDDQQWVVAFDRGQAVESFDYRTCLTRTMDGGKTWTAPQTMIAADSSRPSNDLVRIGRLRDGRLTGFGGRLYRDDPEQGFVNRNNLGYVPMDLFQVVSHDCGATWTVPQWIAPPLVGPAFELCHPIVELPGGQWLAPTSTWRGWNGESPHGMQAIGLLSRDQGASWPDWLTIIDQFDRGVISWEVGLTVLADGRLLAVVWSFDEASGKSLPNRYAVTSAARMLQFSPPRENGLLGETAKLATLADGRVLCLYRRLDEPGLWAALVRIEGQRWITHIQQCVWRGAVSGMRGAESAADELSGLKFGFPSIMPLAQGDVVVCFWCLEDALQAIRFVRLRIAAETAA